MNRKLFFKKISLISFGLVLAFFGASAATTASAQVNEVLIVRQKAKTTIKPKAKPTTNKVDISKKVTITRVDKKSRTTYKKRTVVTKGKKTTKTVAYKPVVRRVQVPLMAIQLRLLKVNEDGSETEANPMSEFSPSDRLRLSVKANQRGYLYIIRQRSPEEEGEIIFPTLLANNGSNYVAANQEYVLPFNCPKAQIPNPRDCALTLFPAEDAPQEYFTLIFTRDSLVGLPTNAATVGTKSARVNILNLMSAGKLMPATLIDLIEESEQDLISQQGDTGYAVRIVNVNAKDNEEIIETFVLRKEVN